jgi:sigma-B regulation protein RsbU (phosphoserine phosphatase)
MSTMPAGSSLTAPQLRLFKPPAPSPAGVDIHAISTPARGFTGDFYLTHRSGDRLWIVVGDVSGKGLSAALIMAMIQEELDHRITSCAVTACDPATTMARLHAFLKPLLPGNKFATIVIAQLHDDGTLVVSNAGHCPPLIRRNDGTVQAIGSTGPVAGLLSSPRWHSVTLHLERGESLLLYSDGVTDADAFEERELKALFSRLGNRPVREVAATIASSVRHSTDDVTVVVAKR